MIEVVYGDEALSATQKAVIRNLRESELEGTFFVGYPILTSTTGAVHIDGLLLSPSKGLLALDFSNLNLSFRDGVPESLLDHHDEIYSAITSKLTEEKRLIRRRSLVVPINIFTLSDEYTVDDGDIIVSTPENIIANIKSLDDIDPGYFDILSSVIERTTTLKPKKARSDLTKDDSRGQKLRSLEGNIAKLDNAQRRAAIEFPEGPQRIRGLAGTGKTIVLAMKASYLHLKYPKWRIALTFYTRSLYQQLTALVTRFSFEFKKDEPDWERLTILHSWGSHYSWGLYAEMSQAVGAPIRNFQYAKDRYSFGSEFSGVISELYYFILERKPQIDPIYDVVLIDEAQDLPQKFFELIYMFTKPPHRIVYAYDELQTLNETEMPSPQELFGKKGNKYRVSLKNEEDRPKQDIVLPVCYRNTPWALTMAHGLGFGIERERGLVQMFATPSTWTEIGYELQNGELALGKEVSLRRSATATPAFFSEVLVPDDAVQFHCADSVSSEYEYLAKSIRRNIDEDELDYDDILIIVSNTRKIRAIGGSIMRALAKEKLTSHIVGITESADEVFSKESIAITHIYRAKGNEAPMVYVQGADYCYDGFNIGTLRNVLFTAITRSKAWVRVSGTGEDMRNLIEEYRKIREDEYSLGFRYPTSKQLSRIKTRYRDISDQDARNIESDLASLSRIIPLIQSGKLDIADLPRDVANALRALINDTDDAE